MDIHKLAPRQFMYVHRMMVSQLLEPDLSMRSLARIEVSRILKSLRLRGGFCFSPAHHKDSKGPSIGTFKLILWLSAWPAFVSVALSTPLVYVTNSNTNIVTVLRHSAAA